MSSFICQFPVWSHTSDTTLLDSFYVNVRTKFIELAGVKMSEQYWYWVWQLIKILTSTQYNLILANIWQYQIPQCQYHCYPTRHWTCTYSGPHEC